MNWNTLRNEAQKHTLDVHQGVRFRNYSEVNNSWLGALDNFRDGVEACITQSATTPGGVIPAFLLVKAA